MRTLAAKPDFQLLASRIAAVTPNDQARWGRMNAYQMLRHLADAFLIPLGETKLSEETSLFRRTLLKWGAFWVPTPWPKGFPTPPEIDQCRLGIVNGDFETARQQVLARLTQLRSARAEGVHHHIFGALTQKEWMRWGWLHTDHHLRQFGR